MSFTKKFLQIPFKYCKGKPNNYIYTFSLPEPYDQYTFVFPTTRCSVPSSEAFIELNIPQYYKFVLQIRSGFEVLEEEEWDADELIAVFDKYGPFISNSEQIKEGQGDLDV